MLNPHEVLNSLLSKAGFQTNGFTVRFDDEVKINIKRDGDSFLLSFGDKKPSVSIRKIIRITVRLSGILLGKTSGTLKIDGIIPDIDFDYEELQNPSSIARKI